MCDTAGEQKPAHPEKTRRERHLRSSRTFQRDRLSPSNAGSSVSHCSVQTVAFMNAANHPHVSTHTAAAPCQASPVLRTASARGRACPLIVAGLTVKPGADVIPDIGWDRRFRPRLKLRCVVILSRDRRLSASPLGVTVDGAWLQFRRPGRARGWRTPTSM